MSKASIIKNDTPASKLTVRQQLIFAAVTVMVPIFLLIVLEAGLRIGGYASGNDLVIPAVDNGKNVYTINPFAGRRYFDQKRYFIPQISSGYFEREKSPWTLRIFILGESTSAGFPYQYNAVPSRILQKQLEIILPEKNIEVINASLTGTNSYTVLDFIDELTPYQPDLFIIYSGQNEFYGALGAASTNSPGTGRWIVRLYQNLRPFKTFLLLENILTAATNAITGSSPAPFTGTLMQQLAKDKSIPFGSQIYHDAVSTFHQNLTEAVRIASDHHIPVLLSTLVTNEKDLAPFVSLRDPELTPSQMSKIDSFFSSGENALKKHEYSKSQQYFGMVSAIDPLWAIGQYRLGQSYDGLGQFDSAKSAFGRARDYDGLRFRASSEMNGIIRSIAQKERVGIADIESTFRAESNGGILGSTLLWEHVHPTFNGYVLLSKTWFEGAKKLMAVSVEEKVRAGITIKDSLLAQKLKVTALDMEIGAMTMEGLMRRWPFTNEPYFDQVPENEMQEVVFRFRKGTIRWNEAHYSMGEIYRKNGDPVKAVTEYESVAEMYPLDPYPFRMMGDIFVQFRMNRNAIQAYERSVALKENLSVRVKLGITYLKEEQFDAAMENLNRAITGNYTSSDRLTEKEFRDAQFFFAVAMFSSGKVNDAGTLVSMLLRQYPDDTRYATLMDEISVAQSNNRR